MTNRKRLIRIELLKRAFARETIFYSELAPLVSMASQGPWKPILDEIALEETTQGRPDITYLVISKQSGLPGQIAFKPAKPPTPQQQETAKTEIKKVFDYYAA